MLSPCLMCSFSLMLSSAPFSSFFFFNDTATTEIYTLSLHDALPIFCAMLLTDALMDSVCNGPDKRCLSLDRKSTRLNSSHVRISYAVFSLKKNEPRIHPDLPAHDK